MRSNCHESHITMSVQSLTSMNSIPNSLSGQLVFTDKAISFWGGIDPNSGKVIDINHPLYNTSLAGKICFFCDIKGSTAAPGALLEWLGSTAAPSAIITLRFEPMVFSAFAAMQLINKSSSVHYAWCQGNTDLKTISQTHRVKISQNILYLSTVK